MLKFDWNALFVLINLIVFFLLMKKFLFGRIAKVIEARRQLINSRFREAEETTAKADKTLAEYESKLSEYKAEGDKIIEGARDDAKVEYDKIIERAENDAEKIKSDARIQMKNEAESARKAAKEEIASLALEAAEKVVGKSVSAETDSEIFDEFLNESSEE
ncbi:MAG: F0F1 ATP synthase subunit B [Eubacterium sp.]|nr:F0F1 ATP synthase subunit B [Eubacterium sp.]